MIDIIYQILLTILNKEQRGNVKPTEFNLLAKQVQEEIFRGYFTDYNRDLNRFNRGLANPGYGNLPFSQRQRIDRFNKTATLAFNTPNFDLPVDLYMLQDKGITYNGTVVDEVQPSEVGYLSSSLGAASATFPQYERVNESQILITPSTIVDGITCRYLRTPADPKWTSTDVSGVALFNPAAGDYQDFELHPDEFSNIVIKMLSYFGINIRETEVTQYAEALKAKQDAKEEA